ncbi:MAG: hypothetical protein HY302_09360 [Opitutae bacterium]|nr:hypothetical protein [Opitutae bacterium]
MSPLLQSLVRLRDRPEARLVLFGLAALAAVWLGFIGLSVGTADQVVKRGGYYVMLLTLALWVLALVRLWRTRLPAVPLSRREKIFAPLALALFTLMALTAEPFRSKILFDEFVLQATAFNMHFFRDVATMVRGYDILGVFLSTDNYLDKRPYFFPFLVSLVHDFTGYRVANAFALNAVLLPVSLGLAFYQGRRLAGRLGGFVAVLLLGSLPLLAQSATGSGMELLNVCLLLGVTALAAAWLRQPDETRLSALVLGTVLLAQTRYESALYAAAAAAVIALGWWRGRRIVLSWPAILAPLLLIPCALQNKVLAHTPVLWELKEHQDSRFSTAYLDGNLRGAAHFFFNLTPAFANSALLSVLGLGALLWVAWRLLRTRPALRTADPDRLALFCFGLGTVANTVLIMFYYWSKLDDPIASRFALPFYLLLAFAAVLLVARLHRRFRLAPVVLAALGLYTVGFSAAQMGYHLYSHLGTDELSWESRVVAARPPGPRLVITNKSTLPWLIEKIPSILVSRARLVADRVQAQLRAHTFTEILVVQSLRPTTADGDHQLLPEDKLPAGFHLQLLAEKRFGTKLTRISRLVAVDDSALPPAKSAGPAGG